MDVFYLFPSSFLPVAMYLINDENMVLFILPVKVIFVTFLDIRNF